MEKEELIEMINSTINTNGSGTITGESLNLALNAIVETMGTGTGTGGGAVWEKVSGTVDLTNPESITVTTTEEDKAANIALIERSKQNVKNGIPVMVYITAFNEEQNIYICPSGHFLVLPLELTGAYALPFIIALSDDGSVTIQVGG